MNSGLLNFLEKTEYQIDGCIINIIPFTESKSGRQCFEFYHNCKLLYKGNIRNIDDSFYPDILQIISNRYSLSGIENYVLNIAINFTYDIYSTYLCNKYCYGYVEDYSGN